MNKDQLVIDYAPDGPPHVTPVGIQAHNLLCRVPLATRLLSIVLLVNWLPVSIAYFDNTIYGSSSNLGWIAWLILIRSFHEFSLKSMAQELSNFYPQPCYYSNTCPTREALK